MVAFIGCGSQPRKTMPSPVRSARFASASIACSELSRSSKSPSPKAFCAIMSRISRLPSLPGSMP